MLGCRIKWTDCFLCYIDMYKCVCFVFFSYTEIIDIIFLKCIFSIMLAAIILLLHYSNRFIIFICFIRAFFNSYLLLIYDWICYLSVKPIIKTAFQTNLISWKLFIIYLRGEIQYNCNDSTRASGASTVHIIRYKRFAVFVELQLNIFEGFWVSLSFNVITTLSLQSAFNIFFLHYINLTVKYIYSCIVKKAYKINKWVKLKQDRGFLVLKTMNYQ